MTALDTLGQLVSIGCSHVCWSILLFSGCVYLAAYSVSVRFEQDCTVCAASTQYMRAIILDKYSPTNVLGAQRWNSPLHIDSLKLIRHMSKSNFRNRLHFLKQAIITMLSL